MSIESIIDYAKKTVDDDDCFTASQIASLHNMLDLISDAIILTDTNNGKSTDMKLKDDFDGLKVMTATTLDSFTIAAGADRNVFFGAIIGVLLAIPAAYVILIFRAVF